jgi:hypothetical protein
LALHVDAGAGLSGKFTYTFFDASQKPIGGPQTTDSVLVGGTHNVEAPVNARKVDAKFASTCKTKTVELLIWRRLTNMTLDLVEFVPLVLITTSTFTTQVPSKVPLRYLR